MPCFIGLVLLIIAFCLLHLLGVRVSFKKSGVFLKAALVENEERKSVVMKVAGLVAEKLNSYSLQFYSINDGVFLPRCSKVPYHLRETSSLTKSDNELTSINSECSICLESFAESEEIVLLSCRHGYHDSCIYSWVANKNETICPLCKGAVFVKTMVDIEDQTSSRPSVRVAPNDFRAVTPISGAEMV